MSNITQTTYIQSLQKLGFEHIALSYYTPDFLAYDASQHDIVSSELQSWHQHFKDSGYDAIDDVAAEAKSQQSMALWDLHQLYSDTSGQMQKMTGEAIDYGLTSGISIADKHASGAFYILVLHSPDINKIAKQAAEKILAARWHTQHVLDDLSKQKNDAKRALLTEKEQNILKLMLKYDTVSGIAKQIYRSPRTVIFHQESIKQKFAINTKTELILLANQLFAIT